MVEMVMVPVPASAPAAIAERFLAKENAASPSTQCLQKTRKDSKHELTRRNPPPHDPTTAGDNYKPDLPPSRFCARRGRHIRQISTESAAVPPRRTRQAASDSQVGILSVGLGKELAEELGMLPGTVYTAANR